MQDGLSRMSRRPAYMHGWPVVRIVRMKINQASRFLLHGASAFLLALGLAACAGDGVSPVTQSPAPGASAVDTRSSQFPGSTIPSVGGASNGGGVSGGGAGVGSIGGGR